MSSNELLISFARGNRPYSDKHIGANISRTNPSKRRILAPQTPNYPTALSPKHRSVEALHHRILQLPTDIPRPRPLAQPEHALQHANLRRRGVHPRNRHPIVDYHPRADEVTPPVHGAGDERHAHEARELVLVARRRLGVHEAALVREGHVGADEDVVGDGLPEDLDAEDVGDDLLRLALEVGVDEGDVVVCGDDVAEGREALFYSLGGVSVLL